MSSATNIGRQILGGRQYKDAVQNTYGVRMGNIDILKEYNRWMLIKLLEWNDTSDYYTDEERQCLESVIKKPSRNCNC